MDKEKFTETGALSAMAEAEFQSQWDGIGISNDFIFGKVMQDKELLAELDAPTEERPDYENCLCWSARGKDDDRDRILLLLDPEAGRLYVIESFM